MNCVYFPELHWTCVFVFLLICFFVVYLSASPGINMPLVNGNNFSSSSDVHSMQMFLLDKTFEMGDFCDATTTKPFLESRCA